MRKICLILSFTLFLLALNFTACSREKSSCYNIVCSYDSDDASLRADMRFHYVNTTGDELSVLQFNLYPNAYREGALYSPVSRTNEAVAYYSGKDYGEIKIESVSPCLTWEIGGEDENLLFVTLERPLKSGSETDINISFTTFLASVNHRLGVTQNCVNLCNFYPILCAYADGFYECVYYSDGDPFFSDSANYSVELTLSRKYKLASSGEIVDKKDTVENTTYYIEGENIRDFAAVFSEKFSVLSKETNGVKINYFYYCDGEPQNSLNAACKSMEYFSQSFGEYPYGEYDVVQTGFCFGGMEYPNLSLISDSLTGKDLYYTIVHETAHQWWYGVVGNNECDEAWMDEGLAECSTMLFFEERPSYGFTGEGILSSARTAYKAFFSVYGQIFGEVDTTMNRNLKDFMGEYEYVNVVYNKSLVMFSCVKDGVGERSFFKALKKFYAEYSFKNATGEDLIACFYKVGKDVKGLFNSFINGEAVV